MSARKLDIGPYVDDHRLTYHDERCATFYGHRCSPAVYVNASADGFHAYQVKGELRGNQWVGVEPTVTADGATAAKALFQIIGPVQR